MSDFKDKKAMLYNLKLILPLYQYVAAPRSAGTRLI